MGAEWSLKLRVPTELLGHYAQFALVDWRAGVDAMRGSVACSACLCGIQDQRCISFEHPDL